jgi:hypothetical protein
MPNAASVRVLCSTVCEAKTLERGIEARGAVSALGRLTDIALGISRLKGRFGAGVLDFEKPGVEN